MATSERIIGDGDFCNSDGALRKASDNNRVLDLDVERARRSVASGKDPIAAYDEVITGGSFGPKAEQNLYNCLYNISTGVCTQLEFLRTLEL